MTKFAVSTGIQYLAKLILLEIREAEKLLDFDTDCAPPVPFHQCAHNIDISGPVFWGYA